MRILRRPGAAGPPPPLAELAAERWYAALCLARGRGASPPSPAGIVELVATALERYADPPAARAFDLVRDATRAVGPPPAVAADGGAAALAVRANAAARLGLAFTTSCEADAAVIDADGGPPALELAVGVGAAFRTAGVRAAVVCAPPSWLPALEALVPPGWLALLCADRRARRTALHLAAGPHAGGPPEGWRRVSGCPALCSPLGGALYVDAGVPDIAALDELRERAVGLLPGIDRDGGAAEWHAAHGRAREVVACAELLPDALGARDPAQRRRCAARRVRRVLAASSALALWPEARAVAIVAPDRSHPDGGVDVAVAHPRGVPALGHRLLLALDGGRARALRAATLPLGHPPSDVADRPIALAGATIAYVQAIERDRFTDAARIALGAARRGSSA